MSRLPDRGTLFDDLALLRRRPGMFLSRQQLSHLDSFVCGWRLAVRAEPACLRCKNGLPFGYLSFHLARKYRQPAAMGWCRILLAECGGDEEAGLARFFRELEEFEALSIRRVEVFVRTPEREWYNRREPTVPKIARGEGAPFLPRFSEAEALYKITLSDGVQMLAVEQGGEVRVETDCFLAFWREPGIDGVLERCFGSVEWAESREDLLGDRVLQL